MKIKFYILALLLISSFISFSQEASYGSTTISNRQEVYGTWTRSNSPYIIRGEAIVPSGRTLTIEPGVTVKFETGDNNDYSKSSFDKGLLHVKGTIKANGSADNFIYFTRDGYSGTWGSIVIDNSSSTNEFSYCNISYGYYVSGVVSNSGVASYGCLSIHYSTANISNCIFHDNSFWTLFPGNCTGPINITNCVFYNNFSYDIYNHVSDVVCKNSIMNNYDNTSGTNKISYSLCKTDISSKGYTTSNNIYGKDPSFVDASSGNYKLSSYSPCKGKGEYGSDMGINFSGSSKSSYSDNNSNSNYSGSSTISDKQEVYGTWTKSKSPYTIKGEAIIPAGKTLTIEPGVTVKFKTGSNKDYKSGSFDRGFLRIKGKIIAKGSSDDFIYFTRDGYSGNWGSIVFDNSSDLGEFEYCHISYGDQVYSAVSNSGVASYGALSIHYSKCNITNCIFTKNYSWTVFPANATGTINVKNCVFYENASTDIYNHVSDVVVKNTILNGYDNTSGTNSIYYSLCKSSLSSKSGYNLGNNIYSKEPEYVDASGGNFRLKSYSPCKGKGEYGVDMGVNYSGGSKSNYSDNNNNSYSGSSTISNKQEVYGTWTKSKSPYVIRGEAIVPEGKTLTIEPGVTVKFKTGTNNYYKQSGFDKGMLRVKGKLVAKGTANDFIFFTRDGSDGTWGSIVIDNSSQTSELEFCKMSHAYHVDGDVPNSLASYGGISVHYSTCNITNCIFTENKFWTLFPANAKLNVTNCTFYDNFSYDIYNHVSDVVVKSSILNSYGNSSGNTTIKYTLLKTKPGASNNFTLSNNIYEQDASFVSASGGNFRLSSYSPCKGKGEYGVDMGVNFSASPSYTQNNDDNDNNSNSGVYANGSIITSPERKIKFSDSPKTHNMHITSDGQYYYTCNGGIASDGQISKFSLSGSLIESYPIPLDMRSIMYNSSDGKLYVSTCDQNIYKITSLSSKSYTKVHSAITSNCQSTTALSPDGKTLYEFYEGTLKIYRMSDGSLQKTLRNIKYGEYSSYVVAADNDYFFTWNSTDKEAYVYDLNGNFKNTIKIPAGGYTFSLSIANGLMFTSDDGNYSTGTWYGYKYRSGEAVANNNVNNNNNNNNNNNVNNNSNNNNNNSNNNNVNNNNVKQPDQNDGFVSDLPPILSIQEITLSKNLLNAEETAQLTITLKNIGAGDASGVYINLSSDMTGLSFKQKNNFPTIAKSGGTQTINIDIKGGLELATGEAVLKIEVVEPKFKVKIQGKQLKFPTREFQKPELIIAKFAVVENLSANPNNQIDINEQIDVKFAVQNVGQGNADNVSISIANNQTGVMLLGVVDNSGNLVRKNPSFTSIPSGKFETITYRYFVNSEFTSTQLAFNVTASERIGKYGFKVDKSVEINKVLQEEGFIRTVASVNDAPVKGKIVIEDIPDFVSDVDQNIPAATGTNDKTFAVVIGNEVYAKEIQVKYALNDARIFKQYLTKTLGLPANNIHYAENATFGQILDALKWINDVAKAYKGDASIIFYYAGHGMPDEQTKSAFILPVDGSSQNTVTAVKLSEVYAKLTEFPTASVTVFLDACFSGASRETNEQMLAQGRGVKINPKTENLNGKIVVFSATTGDETAFPYTEKQHGMFTYFLLKKLQESKGAATLGDIGSYIINNVSQQSIVVNKKSQTPQVNKSPEVENVWSTKKLKQ